MPKIVVIWEDTFPPSEVQIAAIYRDGEKVWEGTDYGGASLEIMQALFADVEMRLAPPTPGIGGPNKEAFWPVDLTDVPESVEPLLPE